MTSKELLRIFSLNVRYLCKQKGIHIGDLESKIGVSKGYISRLVSSEKAMNLANLWNISKILETSMGDLMNEDMAIEHRIQELEEEIKTLKDLKGVTNDR